MIYAQPVGKKATRIKFVFDAKKANRPTYPVPTFATVAISANTGSPKAIARVAQSVNTKMKNIKSIAKLVKMVKYQTEEERPAHDPLGRLSQIVMLSTNI